MRRLLSLACRAFPPDHRARRSDEVVDTALLAADGSALGAAREALSLVSAGARERLKAESRRTLRDGLALLVGILASLNLAIALAGIGLGVHPPPPFECPCGPRFDPAPYVIDWWWIAFALAASAIVVGLVLGNRRLACVAALVNVGIVGYDALLIAPGLRGHLNAIAYMQGGYPAGQEWLAPAVVLVLATAVTPLRRLSLRRLPLTLGIAMGLVALSRERYGFFYLRWPLAAILVLALAFGWLAPRLAVVAVGASLAVVPYVVEYLSVPYAYHDPIVKWVAAPGLALGILLPLAYLTRRRLT